MNTSLKNQVLKLSVLTTSTVFGLTLAAASAQASDLKLTPSTSHSSFQSQNPQTVLLKKKKLKKKKVSRKTIDAISTQNSSASYLAAPISGTTTQSVSKIQTPAKKQSPFSINTNFYYYGSSLQEPTRGYLSDFKSGTGYADAPAYIETHIILGYKINSNMTFSLNPYFVSNGNYKEFNSKTQSYDAKEGQFMSLFSPYARLNFGKFVQAGNFKWNGDFRLYPGLGAAMHGLPIYLRSGQNLIYTLNSKWNLAAYNTIRYYRYTNATYSQKPDQKNLRFTFSPAASYQAMDSLGFELSYNMDVFHPNNETDKGWVSPSHWKSNLPYAELGMSWDATSRINLTPYVDIYLNNVKFYNTMIGLNLGLSIL